MSEDEPTLLKEQINPPGDTLELERPDIGLGDDYETNLPADVNIFDSTDSRMPLYESINPGKLDDLPEGNYFIKGTNPANGNPVNKSMEIVLNNDGKYLPAGYHHQFGNLVPEYTLGAEPLLELVGFAFTEQGTLVPTPITVQRHLKDAGVEAELFADTGVITPEDYVRSFRNGKYPISTGEEAYYAHDISDDHVTGVILGGELFRGSLSKALEHVFSEDGTLQISTEELGTLAEGIDRFTQTLRAVSTYSAITLGEPYGKEKGRQLLMRNGVTIGFDSDTVSQILEASQKRALELGLEVKDLD